MTRAGLHHAGKRRVGEAEAGFTLIELMVVVLIIGILVAVALPTFLGARGRAHDRAAQSSLRNALVAAKTAFTDEGDYTVSDAFTLGTIEPSLTYHDGGDSLGANDISIDVQSVSTASDSWIGSALSKTDTCFALSDVSSLGTTYDSVLSAGGSCDATTFVAPLPNPSW